MGAYAYPTVHKPTFNATLDIVRVMVISELEKVNEQIVGTEANTVKQTDFILFGEKRAYEKVLDIIKNLREKHGQ